MRLAGLILFICVPVITLQGQEPIPGAVQTSRYFPLLAGKNIALVANTTSRIGKIHLADSLQRSGMHVLKIFAPEHGFRGTVDEGEKFSSGVDSATGIRIVSLYGEKYKPSRSDLQGIDIVLFDIQDVGARFYTYLSTLHYMMEACAERKIPLLLLDRPNPNGFYVDGPVLDLKFRSFVGLDPVPVVYGMTIGEYALMLNGEGWLKKGEKCSLQVIPCLGYDHNWNGELPVKPSPNLPTQRSVLLYPSVCLFEGTRLNVGRGTDFPFEVFGAPGFSICEIKYTPRSIPGVSQYSMHQGEACCGADLRKIAISDLRKAGKFEVGFLIRAYKAYSPRDSFFNSYFNTLAGESQLKEQIMAGWTEEKIRESWAGGLDKFLVIRKKYLLYKDFN